MSARALLEELEVAGIAICREGTDIRFKTHPGVSFAAFRDRIVANKPDLLSELLKLEITAAVTIAPDQFDRPAYLRLMSLWYKVEAEVAERRESRNVHPLPCVDAARAGFRWRTGFAAENHQSAS